MLPLATRIIFTLTNTVITRNITVTNTINSSAQVNDLEQTEYHHKPNSSTPWEFPHAFRDLPQLHHVTAETEARGLSAAGSQGRG